MATSRKRARRRTDANTDRQRLAPLILLLILAVIVLYNWYQRRGATAPLTAGLSVQSGQAIITRADAGDDPPLVAGSAALLQQGDTVRTGQGASARIDLSRDQIIELDAGTRLTLTEFYEKPVLRARIIRLSLETGSLRLQTPSGLLAGGSLEIETQVATVQSSAGRIECAIVDPQRVRVRVNEGTGSVSMDGQTVSLKAGQGIEAVMGQPLAPRDEATRTGAIPVASPTSAPQETAPSRPTLTDREKTLFPPAVTPTLPGDDTAQHTVQPGETLYGIARQYGVSWESLYQANRDTLASPDTLRVGQVLRIPPR